jgi:hypothetical protein
MTVRGVSAREAKCVFPVRHSRRTPFSLESLTGRSQIYELDLVDAGHGMQGFHE